MATATLSPVERLARHFSIEPSTDGCWIWTGALSSQGGYPGFTDSDGHFTYAHRFMYENTFGAIPDGWHIHHVCGNRKCIRPEHLEALSPEEHRARHLAELSRKRLERATFYRSLSNAGLTAKAIAEKVGLHIKTIQDYLRLAPVPEAA